MATPTEPMRVALTPSLEDRVARLLLVGTYASIVLIAAGTALLLASGRSPLDLAPGLDPGRLFADLLALHPAGLLWIGLLVVVVTPAARVALSLAGYLQAGEREMSVVALLILLVVLAGIIVGTSAA
jgi:uncharacterized membrane protein